MSALPPKADITLSCQADASHRPYRKIPGSSFRPLDVAGRAPVPESQRLVAARSPFPVSTRVRVTTAARFASKVGRSISNVYCRALLSRAAPPNWPGWPSPRTVNSRPGFVYVSPRHTNGPPRCLRAGLLIDRAVSGNRQISICRAPGMTLGRHESLFLSHRDS